MRRSRLADLISPGGMCGLLSWRLKVLDEEKEVQGKLEKPMPGTLKANPESPAPLWAVSQGDSMRPQVEETSTGFRGDTSAPDQKGWIVKTRKPRWC